MRPYRLHIFVCEGKRCANRGSEALTERLKEGVEEAGLWDEVIVSRSGCIRVCKETDPEGGLCPAVVVYPEGVWYRNIGAGDVEEIIEEHLKKGRVVERLCLLRAFGKGGEKS